MDRRSFIGASIATTFASAADAPAPDIAPQDAGEVISLWPGAPPGALATLPQFQIAQDGGARVAKGVAHPMLCAFRPSKPDGSALIVMPAGGYRELFVDSEGFDVARRFAAAGITCFVLLYRLPHEGWKDARDVPLQDAQRAMRLVRFNAAKLDIDPERTGVIGFSAGGHLAASLATRFDAAVYSPTDNADRLSARPTFAALLYPVVTMLPPFAHEASREMLLGEHPTAIERAAYSCEQLVTRDTPPTFLAAAADDPYVPIENTLEMFASLRAHRVPAEMHIFERGGHAFGVSGAKGLPAADWPGLFLRWGKSRGYFRQAPN